MKIKLKDIIKIQHLEMEIFELKDDDYVNYKKIKEKEIAIYNMLDKVTDDILEQCEIRDCIYKNMWNTKDLTYKPICDGLRALGYEVVE